MEFLDQSDRERQLTKAIQSAVHSGYAVDDFINVFRAVRGEDMRLSGQKVLQGTLGAFNLTGKHRLFSHIHKHKKVGIGQCLDGPIKPSQGPVRE